MGMVLHLNPITNSHLHMEAMLHLLLILMLPLLGMPHLHMDMLHPHRDMLHPHRDTLHLLMATNHLLPNLMATILLSPKVVGYMM